MSIQKQIKSHEEINLWPFKPPGLPLKRRLYLTAKSRKQLTDPHSATNILGLRGYIHGALVRWVTGGLIHADERGKPRFLKRLDPPPPDIWEIRVTDPTPQVRLFGRLVEPDTLIITAFYTRSFLGDRNKPNSGWKEAMPECDKSLSALFPTTPVFRPIKSHEGISENCHEFCF